MELVSFAFQVSEESVDAFDLGFSFPQESPFLGCQLFIRLGDVPTVPLKAEQHLLLPPFRRRLSPRFDRAGRVALALVRNDQVFVVTKVIAESLAGRARAERMVERKEGGLRPLEDASSGLTAVVLSEAAESFAHNVDHAKIVAFPERRFDRFY